MDTDAQRAPKLLLVASDVPGYSPEPRDAYTDSKSYEAFECTRNPVFDRLGASDDPSGASSLTFGQGARVLSPEGIRPALTVASAVTFAANRDDARSAVASLNIASFSGCFSNAYKDSLADDLALSDVSVTVSRLPALDVADESVGYRAFVQARLSPVGQQRAGSEMKMHMDWTFIRSGRAVALLHDVSVGGTPFPEGERARLASVIGGRLATL